MWRGQSERTEAVTSALSEPRPSNALNAHLGIVALNAMRFRAKATKHKDTPSGEGQSERTEAVISALPEPRVSNSLNARFGDCCTECNVF